MGVLRKLRQAWHKARRNFRVAVAVYRQVVAIWRMVRTAQQKGKTSPVTRHQSAQTRATTRTGRTVDVEVIPPRR